MFKNIEDEQKTFDETLKRFKLIYETYDKRLKDWYYHYNDNPLLYANLIEQGNKKIRTLEKNLVKPYFARIDFEEDGTKECEYYISKVGTFDEDNNPITIDWRAPIASLYYDGNLGNVSYLSPEGIINGKLNLKRQFNIEKGKLISFQDVDTVSNDELLKPYLNASNDNRLKNIVATIQSEQNNIIRMPLRSNMIVQGVAGSGKTTVALHRIAFLEYANRENISSSDYMVIGPNKYFMEYIASVLPDLDVYETHQLTFEELFMTLISNKVKIQKRECLDINEDLKYRLSYNFMKDIDKYLDDVFKEFMRNKRLCIGDYLILDNDIILNYYNALKDYDSFQNKIEKLILQLSSYIKTNYSRICSNLEQQYLKLLDKNYINVKKCVKLYCKKELRQLFSLKKFNVIKLYQDILNCNNDFHYEDMAPLMYMYYKIFGITKYLNIRHLVIDEAQDYGYLNFYVLKIIFPNSSFSIYGDLAQSLYSYSSINSWNEIEDIFPDMEIHYLNKSYRTTFEILEFANIVNRKLGLKEAVPVIRHGHKVEHLRYNEVSFLEKVEAIVNDNYDSIAVITKNTSDKSLIEKLLKNYSKVKVFTSFEAKGLEFDAVIIYGIDTYNLDNTLDLKLLYVSITRALHYLVTFYLNGMVDDLKAN